MKCASTLAHDFFLCAGVEVLDYLLGFWVKYFVLHGGRSRVLRSRHCSSSMELFESVICACLSAFYTNGVVEGQRTLSRLSEKMVSNF